MTRKWVLNASPTILLAKISLIEVISKLSSKIIIPSGVVQEIQAGPIHDPARMWLSQTGNHWVTEMSQIEPAVAAWDLGLGENQVLSWCYQHKDSDY